MVFKIICVGSIPAILVIKLVITNSRKKVQLTSRYHRRRRRASVVKSNVIKTRARLPIYQSNLQLVKSNRRRAKFLSNHRTFGPNSNIISKYNTSKTWAVSKNRSSSTFYKSLTSIYLLADLTNTNIKLLEISEKSFFNSVNSYKLASSVLNSTSSKYLTNFKEPSLLSKTVFKQSSSSKFHRHLITRAWSLNVNVRNNLNASRHQFQVGHDGYVPLIFFNVVPESNEVSYGHVGAPVNPLINIIAIKSHRHRKIARLLNAISRRKSTENLTYLKSLASNFLKPYRSKRNSIRLSRRLRLKAANSEFKRTMWATRRRLSRKTRKRRKRKTNFVLLDSKSYSLNLKRLKAKITSTSVAPDEKSYLVSESMNFTRISVNNDTNPLALASSNTTHDLVKLHLKGNVSPKQVNTNLFPSKSLSLISNLKFKPKLTRDLDFYPNLTPWIIDSVVRLIESCSGKKALIQHSMNVEHMVDMKNKIAYRQWIIRMAYYERTLGHRFFMEEALHIIHLSFKYHDVKLFASWLKAIIKRISFWKTRSIFRFLKYVFNNYYRYMFDELSIKGIKIRLKGKISAAGNSRKRTILFRSGKNSYSTVNTKCIHHFDTIVTFTGVMGFQVWLFY